MEDGGNFYSGITVLFRCLTFTNHQQFLQHHEPSKVGHPLRSSETPYGGSDDEWGLFRCNTCD